MISRSVEPKTALFQNSLFFTPKPTPQAHQGVSQCTQHNQIALGVAGYVPGLPNTVHTRPTHAHSYPNPPLAPLIAPAAAQPSAQPPLPSKGPAPLRDHRAGIAHGGLRALSPPALRAAGSTCLRLLLRPAAAATSSSRWLKHGHSLAWSRPTRRGRTVCVDGAAGEKICKIRPWCVSETAHRGRVGG